MKNKLFESFSKTPDHSTDPFGAILEGPKFTFGDKTGKSPDEDPEGLGREEGGAHSRKVDADYENRKDRGLLGDGVSDEERIGIDDFSYDPWRVEEEDEVANNDITIEPVETETSPYDAMADAESLGDREHELVGPPAEEPGSPLEDEHEITSEDVLSAPEEPALEDEPASATDSDLIALSNISTEELLKELEYRLTNKE